MKDAIEIIHEFLCNSAGILASPAYMARASKMLP